MVCKGGRSFYFLKKDPKDEDGRTLQSVVCPSGAATTVGCKKTNRDKLAVDGHTSSRKSTGGAAEQRKTLPQTHSRSRTTTDTQVGGSRRSPASSTSYLSMAVVGEPPSPPPLHRSLFSPCAPPLLCRTAASQQPAPGIDPD